MKKPKTIQETFELVILNAMQDLIAKPCHETNTGLCCLLQDENGQTVHHICEEVKISSLKEMIELCEKEIEKRKANLN